MSLEDIFDDRWNTRIDRNAGPHKETRMDITKLTTEELQKELNRRSENERLQAIARRVLIGELFQEACKKVPRFQEILVPNPKGELADAIFKNPEDYEITLSSFYNPLTSKE